jgi:hypothetical protein
VDAIRRASVAIISFPASGFAYMTRQAYQDQQHLYSHNIILPARKTTLVLTSENTRPNPTFAA